MDLILLAANLYCTWLQLWCKQRSRAHASQILASFELQGYLQANVTRTINIDVLQEMWLAHSIVYMMAHTYWVAASPVQAYLDCEGASLTMQ